jgi:hypothetical protein
MAYYRQQQAARRLADQAVKAAQRAALADERERKRLYMESRAANVAAGNAHDSRTPAPTAWMLCAGTAAVLATTMILAACLRAWDEDRCLYRPLAWVCAAVAVACLALGAARPAPALLGITLVPLLGIPWSVAVARRLTTDESDTTDRALDPS